MNDKPLMREYCGEHDSFVFVEDLKIRLLRLQNDLCLDKNLVVSSQKCATVIPKSMSVCHVCAGIGELLEELE